MSTATRIVAGLAAAAAIALPVATSQTSVAAASTTAAASPEGGSGQVIDLRSHPQDIVTFTSPTGHITCDLARSKSGYTVRCDQANPDWKLPRTNHCGPMGWGDSITATPTSTSLTCHTDTLNGSAKLGSFGTQWINTPAGRAFGSRSHGSATLPYGVTILASNTAGCTSRVTGVTCWDGRTTVTQGFTISKYHYTLHR